MGASCPRSTIRYSGYGGRRIPGGAPSGVLAAKDLGVSRDVAHPGPLSFPRRRASRGGAAVPFRLLGGGQREPHAA